MTEKKTYAVIGTLYAQVSRDIKASSPEEAAEEGWSTFAPSACCHCTKEFELGELHQITVLTEDCETELLVESNELRVEDVVKRAMEAEKRAEEAERRAEAAEHQANVQRRARDREAAEREVARLYLLGAAEAADYAERRAEAAERDREVAEEGAK